MIISGSFQLQAQSYISIVSSTVGWQIGFVLVFFMRTLEHEIFFSVSYVLIFCKHELIYIKFVLI